MSTFSFGILLIRCSLVSLLASANLLKGLMWSVNMKSLKLRAVALQDIEAARCDSGSDPFSIRFNYFAETE